MLADNLTVTWGSQDHYEIVRKVGRGKYSEVCRHPPPQCRGKPDSRAADRIIRSGIRGNKRQDRREVHNQSSQARQEEED